MTDFVAPHRSRNLPHRLTLLLTGSLLGVFTIVQVAQAQSIESNATSRFEIAQASSYTTLFVNPQTGNDSSDGSDRAPFKTLTHALSVAPVNSIISLAPGLYNSANGETFPIILKSGVTVQGEPSNRGQNVIIQGSGQYLSRTSARQQIAVLGSDRAGLRGVTVSNPDGQGYGLWIESSSPIVSDSTFTQSGHDGVSIVGNSAPILKNNYFYQNGANGITIYGTSRPEIRDSIFEKTGFGINITQNAAPRIIGNRITQNKDGIVIQGNAVPIFRSNVIDGNDRDGLVAIANARPDLGTQTDQGNNTFLNNAGLDINAKANSQILPVAGNQYAKTSGRLDANAVEIVAAVDPQSDSGRPIAVPQPIATQSLSNSLVINRPIASVQTPIAITLPTVRSLPPAVVEQIAQQAPVQIPVQAPTQTPVGEELTFTRPDVSAAQSIATPPIAQIPITMPPIAAQPSPTNPAPLFTPAPLAALPSELIVPIAVQPGSGSRELPMPKPAKMKPIPTSMTFNNLVFPNQGNPGSLVQPTQPVQPKSELLPVPGSNIPVGNVGDSVTVWRQPGRRTAIAPTSVAARPVGIKHRVVVEMADEDALKSLIPGAFAVVSGGRQMMQAGAFGDSQKANELQQRLASQGIRATVETF